MCPYGVPFCWCSGASPILRDDEAKTVSNIDSHDLYASYCSPPFPVVVAPSPTSGEQLLDLSFRGAGHPDCIQQPPNYVIDYWSHRLGLSVQTTSAENLSNSATLPPPLPVFDKTSSHAHLGTLDIRPTSQEDPSISGGDQTTHKTLPLTIDQVERQPPQSRRAVRHQSWVAPTRQRQNKRVYDRPGKKPGTKYEPDPIRLQASCRLLGGTDYACQWITTIFSNPVTLGALVRPLELMEIASMRFLGGFEPFLAYHGFIQTASDGFECCLCMDGKRTWWKNKKDAVRHLRKFHFGLADRCDSCTRPIYSKGEMTSHRCVPPKRITPIISTIEQDSGTLDVLGNPSSGGRVGKLSDDALPPPARAGGY